MNMLLDHTIEALQEQELRYRRRLSITPNDPKTMARHQYVVQVLSVRMVERDVREDLAKASERSAA